MIDEASIISLKNNFIFSQHENLIILWFLIFYSNSRASLELLPLEISCIPFWFLSSFYLLIP
jgi:hypothetical protein